MSERQDLTLCELGHVVQALRQLPDAAARQLLLALADPHRYDPPA